MWPKSSVSKKEKKKKKTQMAWPARERNRRSEFTWDPFSVAHHPCTSDISLGIREKGYWPAEILNVFVGIWGCVFVWNLVSKLKPTLGSYKAVEVKG